MRDSIGEERLHLDRLRFALLFVAALLLHHFGLWLRMCRIHHITLAVLLNHWDGGHYSNIVREGYTGERWAFLPLYPMLVRGVASVTGTLEYPQFVGTVLSTLILVAFVIAVEFRAPKTPGIVGLAPRSNWGWFLFLYSPASYVFHSHHTESLFLLTSFFAFSFAAEGKSVSSGVFAGLSVLTRVPGLLVAPFAAWLSMHAKRGAARWVSFVTVGSISAVCLGLLMAFEYHWTGDALAFITAHRHWTHAHSLEEIRRAFWMGNPWQGVDRVSVSREIFFFAWVIAALALTVRQRPLGAYCLLSAVFPPLQAELINAFRYGAVLFPLAFFVGDWLADRPIWLRWASVPAVIAVNHWVTLSYARMGWAY